MLHGLFSQNNFLLFVYKKESSIVVEIVLERQSAGTSFLCSTIMSVSPPGPKLGGNVELCSVCNDKVYPLDRFVIEKLVMHKGCFKVSLYTDLASSTRGGDGGIFMPSFHILSKRSFPHLMFSLESGRRRIFRGSSIFRGSRYQYLALQCCSSNPSSGVLT